MDQKKKIAPFFILFVWGFIFPYFSFSNSDSFIEQIENFSVEIKIQPTAEFLVKETIVYDFGNNLKHGIWRQIPLGKMEIKVEKTIDEMGNEYPKEIQKSGDYLMIKIGNPNVFVSGRKVYNIFYRVQNGLSFFQDYDEIYWNVTGNEWNVPIQQTMVSVYLPQPLPREKIKTDCFTGIVGSREKNCFVELSEGGEIIFRSTKKFLPKEGLTIVVGWPKGIVKESQIQKEGWVVYKKEKQIKDFFPYFLPVFVFLYLLREWWLKGRDEKIKEPLVIQYEPPEGLRPAEVGFILNQASGATGIVATLVDLAIRG